MLFLHLIRCSKTLLNLHKLHFLVPSDSRVCITADGMYICSFSYTPMKQIFHIFNKSVCDVDDKHNEKHISCLFKQ